MRYFSILLVFGLLVFAVSCDTELGHSHSEEEHDHDGDGIPDHTEEEHHADKHDGVENELPHE